MEALIRNIIARLLAGKGCRGHNASPDHSSGSSSPAKSEGDVQHQARTSTQDSHRPFIGHLKAGQRMGRNYL
jgi:hypothetical protein